MHMKFDWQSCNLIGELKFRLTKVLGPRKETKVTRPSFWWAHVRLWARDYLYIGCRDFFAVEQLYADSHGLIALTNAATLYTAYSQIHVQVCTHHYNKALDKTLPSMAACITPHTAYTTTVILMKVISRCLGNIWQQYAAFVAKHCYACNVVLTMHTKAPCLKLPWKFSSTIVRNAVSW